VPGDLSRLMPDFQMANVKHVGSTCCVNRSLSRAVVQAGRAGQQNPPPPPPPVFRTRVPHLPPRACPQEDLETGGLAWGRQWRS